MEGCSCWLFVLIAAALMAQDFFFVALHQNVWGTNSPHPL